MKSNLGKMHATIVPYKELQDPCNYFYKPLWLFQNKVLRSLCDFYYLYENCHKSTIYVVIFITDMDDRFVIFTHQGEAASNRDEMIVIES